MNAWQGRGKPAFDLVIANDIETLPAALEIAAGSPVLLDAHEYSPRQSADLIWRILTAPYIDWLCRSYINKAALLATVNNSLAEEYELEYGKKAIIIYN